jgi:hypothetical protein
MSNELDPTDFDAVIGYYNIGGLDRQQERLTEPNIGANMTDKDRPWKSRIGHRLDGLQQEARRLFLG